MEQLENKEIINVSVLGERYDTKVAGIDRSVGVTIVCIDKRYPGSKGLPAFCLNGPSSPHYQEYCLIYPLYEEKYEEMFDIMIKQIEEGIVYTNTFYDMLNATHSLNGGPSCAYSS